MMTYHGIVSSTDLETSVRPSDGMYLQKELLISEGIRFDSEGRVDLEKYGWRVRL